MLVDYFFLKLNVAVPQMGEKSLHLVMMLPSYWFIWLLLICFVHVLKVVTCGNVPLESSFQKVPRCVYTSTSLYEYRGWSSKAANPTHRRFTWGLRSLEVSD